MMLVLNQCFLLLPQQPLDLDCSTLTLLSCPNLNVLDSLLLLYKEALGAKSSLFIKASFYSSFCALTNVCSMI